MNRVALALGILVWSSAGFAADAKTKSQAKAPVPSWRFERIIDKMTDRASCQLTTPFSSKLSISFQALTALQRRHYLVSSDGLALLDGGTLTIRVDKNEAIAMRVNGSMPRVSYVDHGPYVITWLGQMESGKTLLAQVVSQSSAVEEQYTLDGFVPAAASWRECIKTLP